MFDCSIINIPCNLSIYTEIMSRSYNDENLLYHHIHKVYFRDTLLPSHMAENNRSMILLPNRFSLPALKIDDISPLNCIYKHTHARTDSC